MNKKLFSKIIAPLLLLPLTFSATGCSADRQQACDRGKPISEPQEAVRILLEAAETIDYDKACSVIMDKLDETVMNTQLAALKTDMDSAEVTSSNFTMVEFERGGPAHFYHVYADQPDKSVDLTLMEVGKGSRIAFGYDD
ncbi:hypothetical protein [Arthrobacter sp. MYb213]|uniref:hypothetical protein n=1 Tax=Arthrobacter sp. MYb213 TaxID=1848595 RepID=UPI000CFBFD5B|nr:hypothetical protein [Arthrobacter sp. MYb213]PRB69454.1 hypothetical protein CQ011_11835 [Arthrobacter sp. MYb213]